jgi:hypothetical protein
MQVKCTGAHRGVCSAGCLDPTVVRMTSKTSASHPNFAIDKDKGIRCQRELRLDRSNIHRQETCRNLQLRSSSVWG